MRLNRWGFFDQIRQAPPRVLALSTRQVSSCMLAAESQQPCCSRCRPSIPSVEPTPRSRDRICSSFRAPFHHRSLLAGLRADQGARSPSTPLPPLLAPHLADCIVVAGRSSFKHLSRTVTCSHHECCLWLQRGVQTRRGGTRSVGANRARATQLGRAHTWCTLPTSTVHTMSNAHVCGWHC